MSLTALEERVSAVEVTVAELKQMFANLMRLHEQTEESVQRLSEEMRRAEERAARERREMNRRWGELANKMGTLAEDMVAPNVPRVLRDLFGCREEEITFFAVRVVKRHAGDPHRVHEFDVVAVCGDYVLVNETKSTLNAGHVDAFVRTLAGIRDFFPEYKDKKFLGLIATLYMRPEIATYAERQGLIAMGFGDDTFDVLNSPDFRPRIF